MLAAVQRRNPRTPLLGMAIGLALSLALVAGCSPGANDVTGSTAGPVDGSTSATPVPPGWVPCRGGLECTTLEVPADWEEPAGEQIDLAVVRRPATSGTPRGVILANPGGPGGSGLDWLAAAGDLSGLGEFFDLVSWDPRGVGESTQLDCGGIGGPGGTDIHRLPATGPQAEATAQAVADFVAACSSGSPTLINRLGTDQGVADMEAVRVATGAEQVDVIGFSYGTYLGLAYARAYPEHVRTLVLDAAVDPADSLEELLTAQATAMEALLDELLADDPGRWDRAAAQTDPATLAFAAIAATYTPGSRGLLPNALTVAADGDDSLLRNLADSYFDAATYTAYLGTLCADLDRPTDPAAQAAMAQRLEARAPRLGGAIAGEVAGCASWPVPNGAPWQPLVPPGVPVIVIGATGDVATPLSLAESVADALGGAVLVVRDGGGHISLGRSTCVDESVTRLLLDGTLPVDPTTCPSGR